MKKNITLTALCLSFLFILTSCAPQNTAQTATVFAMDTVMELTVYGDGEVLRDAEQLIYSLDAKLSATDEHSEIYKLNRDKSATVSADTAEIITRALDICKSTDGALDISIYPVVSAWGFTKDEHRIPSDDELSELLDSVDYSKISVDGRVVTILPDMQIDLGSVAKGYTGDRVTAMLRERGVESALLNLGGNVQTVGTKPDGSNWRVAVSDPAGSGYAGIIETSDRAVITSGSYERYFEEDGVRYHHIIDPKTGKPAASDILSVTVIGESGMMCDALSTALFVMGVDRGAEFLRENREFEAIFITDDGRIYLTSGLEDSFTPSGMYENAEIEVLNYD